LFAIMRRVERRLNRQTDINATALLIFLQDT
jgi:hypothetical protein